jgi:endonuclease I
LAKPNALKYCAQNSPEIIMKNCLALFFLLTLAFNVFAESKFNYYPQQFRDQLANDTLNKESIKFVLFNILSGLHSQGANGDVIVQECLGKSVCYSHISLDYSEAKRFLFGKISLKKDDQGYYVEDLYCQKKIRRSDLSTGQIGPMQIPDKIINCEHTWPQSKFTKNFPERMQKGDLHHLYPVNMEANSTRGNYPFGSEPEVIGEHRNYSEVTTLNNCESSRMLEIFKAGQFFEPPASHRGNVARSLFYFSIRYKMNIDPIQEKFLRLWNTEDPIDSEEIERNNQVFEIQKNRNPFVDFPELADNISDF